MSLRIRWRQRGPAPTAVRPRKQQQKSNYFARKVALRRGDRLRGAHRAPAAPEVGPRWQGA
eukprot:906573-Heterocapsa_arctica.AAC.1